MNSLIVLCGKLDQNVYSQGGIGRVASLRGRFHGARYPRDFGEKSPFRRFTLVKNWSSGIPASGGPAVGLGYMTPGRTAGRDYTETDLPQDLAHPSTRRSSTQRTLRAG